MKRKLVKILFIVAVVFLVGAVSVHAVVSTLSPGPHNGTANSGSVTKTSSGGPSMYVNSIQNMTQSYFWCRLRSGSVASTPAYKFTSTGSKTMYYLTGEGEVGDPIFVRVQTHADETNTITVQLTWYRNETGPIGEHLCWGLFRKGKDCGKCESQLISSCCLA